MAQKTKAAAKPRGPGRPFKKGQSGNPGGRPKNIIREIREKYGKDVDSIVEVVRDLARNPMVEPRDRVAAAKLFLERLLGRPVTPMELTGAEGEPLVPKMDLKRLSDAELMQLIELQKKATGG
jgi:hypothetical protein